VVANRNFEIKGVEGVLNLFHELPLVVEKKILKTSIRKSAQILQSAMIRRAPVGFTGRLAESIKTTARGLKNKLAINVIVGRFYSRFLEFGTSKMSAKPFVRPAYDEAMPEIINTFSDEMNKGVIREAKKLGRGK